MKKSVSQAIISDPDNFYFVLAVFAILLAGNLLWWEAQEASFEFEREALLGRSLISDRETRELLRMTRSLELTEAQLEQEFQDIEQELNP